jgi:hypothetical protein
MSALAILYFVKDLMCDTNHLIIIISQAQPNLDGDGEETQLLGTHLPNVNARLIKRVVFGMMGETGVQGRPSR